MVSSAKRDQMIESLVWFSFHTPRTVLEDLILHELEIYKKRAKMGIISEDEEVDDEEDAPNSTDDDSLSSLSEDGDAGRAEASAKSFTI